MNAPATAYRHGDPPKQRLTAGTIEYRAWRPGVGRIVCALVGLVVALLVLSQLDWVRLECERAADGSGECVFVHASLVSRSRVRFPPSALRIAEAQTGYARTAKGGRTRTTTLSVYIRTEKDSAGGQYLSFDETSADEFAKEANAFMTSTGPRRLDVSSHFETLWFSVMTLVSAIVLFAFVVSPLRYEWRHARTMGLRVEPALGLLRIQNGPDVLAADVIGVEVEYGDMPRWGNAQIRDRGSRVVLHLRNGEAAPLSAFFHIPTFEHDRICEEIRDALDLPREPPL
jgi:hypothetical protein